METLTVSSETFQQALCWINGEESSIQEVEVKRLIESLSRGYRNAFRREHPENPVPRLRALMPSPLSLSSLLGEDARKIVQPEKQPEPQAENCAGPSVGTEQASEEVPDPLDSAELINAIAYVSMRSGIQMTQSRAQIILYCLYGSRLGAGKERLEIEHPQMWKYGPVFPRAYRRSAPSDYKVCERSYRGLMDTHPELIPRLEGKTSSMMGTPMSDLAAVHKGERSPYGRLLRKNPSKWGMQIPDEDIARFFKGNRI